VLKKNEAVWRFLTQPPTDKFQPIGLASKPYSSEAAAALSQRIETLGKKAVVDPNVGTEKIKCVAKRIVLKGFHVLN
jgi:hypothetical protein